MVEFDRIIHNPNVMGGKPTIRGMRVTVGMIVRQIGPQMAEPRRHKITAAHANLLGTAEYVSQRNRPIMAAQAQLAGSGRLSRHGIQRRGSVNLVAGNRQVAIPQRSHTSRVVRRMTKDANLRFRLRTNSTRPGRRKIVYRIDNPLLRRCLRMDHGRDYQEQNRDRKGVVRNSKPDSSAAPHHLASLPRCLFACLKNPHRVPPHTETPATADCTNRMPRFFRPARSTALPAARTAPDPSLPRRKTKATHPPH